MSRKKQQNPEVPGNVMMTHALVQRDMLAFANAIWLIEGQIANEVLVSVTIKSINIKFPPNPRGEYMTVTRASVEGKQVVAFHKADTLREAIRGTVARISNGSMTWKEDQYA